MISYYVGLDLGQAQDFTALSVVEKKVTKTEHQKGGYTSEGKLIEERDIPLSYEYQVRHLQRFRLGTSYSAVVSEVRKVLSRLSGAVLVVDYTGVGRPVVDLFRDSGLSPVAVTITSGDKATFEDGGWRVPKRDLVSVLVVAFQNSTLKIAEALPEARTLIEELQHFQVKIDPRTAHDSYGSWREGVHDDLVLSVAMALWYASRENEDRFIAKASKRNW